MLYIFWSNDGIESNLNMLTEAIRCSWEIPSLHCVCLPLGQPRSCSLEDEGMPCKSINADYGVKRSSFESDHPIARSAKQACKDMIDNAKKHEYDSIEYLLDVPLWHSSRPAALCRA